MSSLITLSRHFHQVRGKRGRVSLDGIPNHSCEQETEKQEETQGGGVKVGTGCRQGAKAPERGGVGGEGLGGLGGTWEVAEGLGKDESGRLCRGQSRFQ